MINEYKKLILFGSAGITNYNKEEIGIIHEVDYAIKFDRGDLIDFDKTSLSVKFRDEKTIIVDNLKNTYLKGIITTNYLYHCPVLNSLTGAVDIVIDMFIEKCKNPEVFGKITTNIMKSFQQDTLVDMETYQFFDFCTNTKKKLLMLTELFRIFVIVITI